MTNRKISSVRAFETLDSRGNPTVTVHLALEGGGSGMASVPSGASTGEYEAAERRDGEPARFSGRGTQKVCADIEKIILPAIRGLDVSFQRALDLRLCELDGTENKSRLGANAILAVSLAAARAAANAYEMPLYRYLGGIYGSVSMPVPMMNILNGGRHADNNIDIQEFMIVPVGAQTISEAVRIGSEVYHALRATLQKEGYATSVGDEGGFAPDLSDDEAAIELILKAIETAGYTTDEVKLALDVAASEWADGDSYSLPGRGITLSAEELIHKFEDWCGKYPILSIEDPVGENDAAGWKAITERLGGKIMLVGDDLFVTNSARLRTGIENGIANAVLVKPNQIGTLSETLDTVRLAAGNGYKAVISHRSGETSDTFISDIAVATSAGFLKAGAPARGERVAKYNRLIQIERLFD
ncbi:MAG: phosphopyruvate hydratase [Clostridiales bacterium]|nr:phosphopyruvate hydratase [Clostridiales bacterium]